MKNNINTLLVGIIVVSSLVAGAVYAWSGATWHDPATWISSGSKIKAEQLGESMEYLYAHITPGQDILSNLNCSVGQGIQWVSNKWICADIK